MKPETEEIVSTIEAFGEWVYGDAAAFAEIVEAVARHCCPPLDDHEGEGEGEGEEESRDAWGYARDTLLLLAHKVRHTAGFWI